MIKNKLDKKLLNLIKNQRKKLKISTQYRKIEKKYWYYVVDTNLFSQKSRLKKSFPQRKTSKETSSNKVVYWPNKGKSTI